eukprot:SAG11_NODE_3090_length_2701_cov_8.656802_2_plen_89_part_00
MADIVADVLIDSVLGTENPLAEKPAVDTDAVLIPDHFAPVRRLLTTGEPDFKPSRLVRVAQVGMLLMVSAGLSYSIVHVQSHIPVLAT